jgi:hypothetical protein
MLTKPVVWLPRLKTVGGNGASLQDKASKLLPLGLSLSWDPRRVKYFLTPLMTSVHGVSTGVMGRDFMEGPINRILTTK